ncbi:epoxide hydrolase family protein [Spongisporangium articulatum]|uniref:Epoxide hydrolase family protein n=1 Tax=Spongisporangium articulatum TaxID=3362603 RepID=A0ABW8AQ13_9ACTN
MRLPEAVDDAVLDDLRSRLRATRRVALTRGTGWDRGTDPDYLSGLLTYWAEDYDWRPHEQRILSLPWVPFDDGFAIHQRAEHAGAPTVVLLHGWPDSFLRFERVLPLLPDVNVVVPALPGYPFGPATTEPGSGARPAMGTRVLALLAELGHERCVVAGGDIGTGVAEAMAREAPTTVAALHLTDIPLNRLASVPPAELTEAERRYVAGAQEWSRTEGAYLQQQATKPHTLAVGLGDSPAGLAAWILEKLRSWSDCGGDVETAFGREDLLTWLTLYWVTGTIGSSFAAYVERPPAVLERLATPLAVTQFEHDLVKAPREFAERWYAVRSWEIEASGGHFAAWERPEAFVAGVRRALALS